MNWKDIVKKDKRYDVGQRDEDIDDRLTTHRKRGKKQMKEMYGDSKDPYGKPEAESLFSTTRSARPEPYGLGRLGTKNRMTAIFENDRKEGVKRTMPLYPIGDGDDPVVATRIARERAKRKNS